MPEHLHTVEITGSTDSPKIEFTCHGDRAAECHSYPDCKCETWHRHDPCHPFVAHDKCWMQPFFDNAAWGAIDPLPETFADCDITPGMSGPITTSFNGEYIEWDFTAEEAKTDA